MSAPVNPLSDTNTTSTTQNKDESSQPSHNTQENTTTNETTTNNESEQKASENENIEPERKPKPKRCPHINNMKKKIKKFHSISCEKCPRNSDANDKLVFCLSCFKLNCSRTSEHAHGFNHWSAMSKHSLSMMIPTFEEYMNNPKDIIINEILTIWCYKCDSFLHELNQDNTKKIMNLKYDVYGCLQRGYKKLANKHKHKMKQQNNYNNYNNNVSDMPNYDNVNVSGKNKKKKDKYAQYKNQFNNNIQTRNNNKNISNKSIEEWSKLNDKFIIKMDNDHSNGCIGIFGLSNLGNTCFFNSILQNLSETRPLIKALTVNSELIKHTSTKIKEKDLKNPIKINKNDSTPRGRRNAYGKKQQQQMAMDKKLRGRLLTEFNHVITDAYKSVGGVGRKGAVVPSSLLNAVVARNRRFAGRRQQDSHELMRVLVEGMRDQNEKMLKKARKHNINRNLKNWTCRDILNWSKYYNIKLIEQKKPIESNETETNNNNGDDETNVFNDIQLDINTNDFKEFLKGNNDEIFFNKLGLNNANEKDIIIINNWKRGRICLTHEECIYYCKKHGIDMKTFVNNNKTKENEMNSKVHDIKNKPLHKINTIIDNVFGGEIQSCVTCYGCGNVSRTTEEFFDLSLPISNPKTSPFGGYGGNNNAWFTKKKSKKQKKKEKQKKWAQQNKKNNQQNSKKKNNKRNKGNKQKHNKHKKIIENEENIELADGIVASINISKSKENNQKIDNKKLVDKNNNEQTVQKRSVDKSDNKDKNNDQTDGINDTSSTNTSPVKSVSEISTDSPVKSETKTEKKEEIKEEKTEKYIPLPLPSIRGMDRLKGNVNLLDCLAAFTDPELLSESDKYGCKYCTRKVLQKIKNENKNKWDEIIQKYLLLKNKNEEDEEEKDNNSNNESDTDSDIENRMDIFDTHLDEMDRLISCGYPLQRHIAKKQILIHSPPQVLALHLKRFEQQGYRLSKVGKRVPFPLHLNIGKYLTNECKLKHMNNNNENEVECMYQLYGISVHHGSMGGGHYIAYTHKHRNNGPKDGWYYFSDSSYRSVNYQDAMRAEAYVLFYQKCENNKQQENKDNETENDK